MGENIRHLGKYEILDEIGKGGFATVYRARDPDLDRVVALKVLDPLLTRDPVWVARFRREARAVARLDHPHVVTIYEVGEAEGLLYIAARLVEGGHLRQRLARQGPFPWSDVVCLVGEIASALDYAHDQGVIHRDLKAANVLLDEERGALLTDFGFASIVSESSYSISVSGGVVGTPQYIAPEVWEGETATARTDVYALGCILYEMVMGEHLFGGDTTPAVMRAHFKPLALPEAWPEGGPAGLAEVLETALAKEPEARFNRAGELAQALAELKEDTLAAPYAALEAAVAGEAWEEALALSRQIQTQAPDYRDVAALEEQALDGLEQVARAREAATWREEAERALAEGDLQGAEMAARRWEALTSDDPGLAGFRTQLEEADKPAPKVPALKSGKSLPTEPAAPAEREPEATVARSQEIPPEPLPDPLGKRRRRIPVWGWAMGGIVLLAMAVGLLMAFGVVGSSDIASAPTKAPLPTVNASTRSAATVQSRATATVRAQRTTTAQVRATATAQVLATTQSIQATVTAAEREAVQVAGPMSGLLQHQDDGSIRIHNANGEWRDFIAETTFYNPYASTTGDWGYGFMCRRATGDYYAVYVRSTGVWHHSAHIGGEWISIEEGKIADLRKGSDDNNVLRLIASGQRGYLFVNEKFVAMLDMSRLMRDGSIQVATGIMKGDEIKGKTTRFEGFTIWSLEGFNSVEGVEPTALPASSKATQMPEASVSGWFWRGHGPLSLENGAIGIENYTDRVLTIRIDGIGEYQLPADKGSVLAIEVPPDKYVVYARVPDLAEHPFSGFGNCQNGMLKELRALPKTALVIPIVVAPYGDDPYLGTASCPWYEEMDAP